MGTFHTCTNSVTRPLSPPTRGLGTRLGIEQPSICHVLILFSLHVKFVNLPYLWLVTRKNIFSFSELSNNEELWEEPDIVETDISIQTSSPPPLPAQSNTSSFNTVVVWLVGFLLLLQSRHYIPDSAMFLHVVFCVLGRLSLEISSMASSIPSSVHLLGKFSGHSAEFMKYMVCPKCHHLYNFSDCITHTGYSKPCNFIKFPNHPHSRHRAECGQLLLKTVTFSSGRQILYPFKIFPFKHSHLRYCFVLALLNHASIGNYKQNLITFKIYTMEKSGRIFKRFLASLSSLVLGVLV